MSRIPRKKLNTSFFHVMSQGINKSYIFDEENEIIADYLKNKKIEEVLKNKEELKQLVSYLKKDKKISFLTLGREKLRKLL